MLGLTSYAAPAYAHDATLYNHAELSEERQFLRDAAHAYALVDLIEFLRAAATPAPIADQASPGPVTVQASPEWTPEGADVAGFLECTRAVESGGNYRVHSSNGKWHGAYQFDIPTWNGVASRIAPELVGVNPADASPADQDRLAAQLYSERGNQPWGGRC